MYLLWNFRTFLLFHDWRSLSELDSKKRRLVSLTMSDDDYVVQRMLDGESEEDEDEPNETNVELPLGAGVDLTVCRALPEAPGLREQRPNDAFARMMSHSRLQRMQPSQRASSSSSSSKKSAEIQPRISLRANPLLSTAPKRI